jgi:hypothetical protein
MKYKAMMTIFSLAEMALIAAFLWYAWQADKAMDKAGIGNLELCQRYNSYAGTTIALLSLCGWRQSLSLLLPNALRTSPRR